MKTWHLCLAAALMALAGCVSTPEPPQGALSEAQMVAVLTETYLADAYVNTKNPGTLPGKAVYGQLQANTFKRLGIDSADYKKTYAYYLVENPKGMERIMAAVKQNLTQLVDSLNTQPEGAIR